MKKALALLLALVMVISMAACGSKTTTPSTNAATTPAPAGNETEAQVEASELKVGVFYYTFADTYISSVRTALDAQLDSLGVTYNNFDGNNNQTTQNEQIQTAVTDGYNLLVVNMVTPARPRGCALPPRCGRHRPRNIFEWIAWCPPDPLSLASLASSPKGGAFGRF